MYEAVSVNNKVYTLDEFENLEELVVHGGLNLNVPSSRAVRKLPNKLRVEGDLILENTDVEFLPDNLSVGGTLSITGCPGLTTLPKNLKVGIDLVLFGTHIKFLPHDLEVGFKIYADNANELKGNHISYRDNSFVKLYKGNSIKFILSLLGGA